MIVGVGLGVVAGILVLGVRVPRRVGPRPAHGENRRPRPARVDEVLELSVVLSSAAAQLRAGATPSAAWTRALGRPVGGVPSVDQLLGASAGWRRAPAARLRRAAAVVAAARLSDDLGAPLATVLDRVAIGLAADEECESERTAALAGPRATAQVLAWLPMLGLVLGVALGANPVAVALDGGLGTAAVVTGVALVVLGRWWTAALLARAERDDARTVGAGRVGADTVGRTVGVDRAVGALGADTFARRPV